MVKPLEPWEMARATKDYAAGYLSSPVTARKSARAVWWAFCRGIGYGLARAFFRAFRG